MAVTFDELIEQFNNVVTVIECDLYENTGDYGMFAMRHDLPFIFIERNQPEIDKKMMLVEEFKHMMTSYGVILKQNSTDQIKQENKARGLTYKQLVTMDQLFECYIAGTESEYEIAEELDVPQEFLHNAIEYFKETTDGPIKLDNGYIAIINDTIQFYKTDDHRKAK
jgi:hypothetical protein